MNIYHYSELTFEYINTTTADLDPVETKKKGEFVPLVPKFATTIKPPKVGKNEVAVFENNKWIKKADYRFTHKKVNEDLTVVNIVEIGEIDEIIVENSLADAIKQNPNLFKIENNAVIEKTKEDLDKEEKEQIAKLKLTKREVFLALYQAKGITPDMIKAKITDPLALIEFEYANDYFRGNPLIDEIGKTLGLTTIQLDNFFKTNDYKVLVGE